MGQQRESRHVSRLRRDRACRRGRGLLERAARNMAWASELLCEADDLLSRLHDERAAHRKADREVVRGSRGK